MMTKDIIFNQLKEHKPIIVNLGKGYFSNSDIKIKCIYDEEIQKYRGEIGIWSNKLLKEILNGEVENTKLELGE